MGNWSIALSGGGHRASLFGLGALMYVADAGLNKDVTSICSVSGGSFTNGYLASRVDYPTISGPGFDEAMRPLARRCAITGTVQWAWEAKALLAGIGLGIALGVGCWWLPVWTWLRIVLFLVALAGVLVLLQCRSAVAERILRRLLFSRGGAAIRLANLRPGLCHVFCATEVQSKVHAYFARRFVYSFEFGVSTGGSELFLSTAVQASSCLPGVFTPRSLKAVRLGFARAGRKRLWLVDGGVYDNMGDQWAQRFHDRAASHPELAEACEQPSMLLVVNASGRSGWAAAPWLARVPLFGELLALLKEKDILYQNSTTNRRRALISQFDVTTLLNALPDSPQRKAALAAAGLGGSLIHIGSTPAWVAEPNLPESADKAACERVAAKLASVKPEWLNATLRRSRNAKTTLAAVGVQDAIALLWHGYVLTMVNLHVFHAAPLLDLPSEDRLRMLIM